MGVQPLYPQLGIVVGIPVMILLCVAAVLVWRAMHRKVKAFKPEDQYDEPDDHAPYWVRLVTVIFGGGLIIATVVTVIVGMMPFQPKYWSVYAVEGRVAGISNQLSTSDSGITGVTYTIAFKSGPARLYTSDDTRLSSVKPGDELGLKCRPSWHLNAIDSWSCDIRNFGRVSARSEEAR
jgi:hypothetical protein